jgi:hypothetical protein
MHFTIEAAELIIESSGEKVSGGTIIWDNAKTEKQAKKIGNKLIENNNVWSVWIHKWENEEKNDDPLYQWRKYKSDKDWFGTSGW